MNKYKVTVQNRTGKNYSSYERIVEAKTAADAVTITELACRSTDHEGRSNSEVKSVEAYKEKVYKTLKERCEVCARYPKDTVALTCHMDDRRNPSSCWNFEERIEAEEPREIGPRTPLIVGGGNVVPYYLCGACGEREPVEETKLCPHKHIPRDLMTLQTGEDGDD